MKQAFRDAEETLDKIDNIHYIEAQLWSEKLGTAGRTDVIGDYDGVLSVIDFKTSLREKKESYIQNYFEQGTAYAEMYEERVGKPIDQIVIIISVDGLDYPQVFIKNKKDHIENLMSKILAYKKEFFHVS
jgi:genome maintenance exonuclease 1